MEVLVDGAWWPGDLHAWHLLDHVDPGWLLHREPGYEAPALPLWHGIVEWHDDRQGHGGYVPSDRIRPWVDPDAAPT